jgi:hypothetical protein
VGEGGGGGRAFRNGFVIGTVFVVFGPRFPRPFLFSPFCPQSLSVPQPSFSDVNRGVNWDADKLG